MWIGCLKSGEKASGVSNDDDAEIQNTSSRHGFNSAKCRSIFLLPVLSALTIIGSGGYTLLLKFCYNQIVPPCDGCLPRNYSSPFLQTAIAFTAQIVCFLMYFAYKLFVPKSNSRKILEEKKQCPFYLLAIPAFIDFTGTCLYNYAALFVSPSVVTIESSFIFVAAGIFTMAYLRRALRICNFVGTGPLILSLALIGVASLNTPDAEVELDSNSWIGVVLALVSSICYGFQYVFEEKLIGKYTISPFLIIAFEGMFGIFITTIALIIFHYTGVENFMESIYQIFKHPEILGANIGFFFSHLTLMTCGIMVTVLGSSLLRSVLSPLQAVLLFFAETLILQWVAFEVLACIGVIAAILSILLFNNLIFCIGCKKVNKFLGKPVVFLCLLDPDSISTNN